MQRTDNGTLRRWIGRLGAVFLFLSLGVPANAQDSDGLREADRLFALAKQNWAHSTSISVEQLLLRALALRQAALPESDPRVGEAEDQLGRVYYNRGLAKTSAAEFQKAEQLFGKAAARVRESLGPESLTLADYLGDLGAALRQQRRYVEASREVCSSLKIRRTVLPADAPVLAASLNNLSLILAGLGQEDDAASLQRDARNIQLGTVGDDDPARRVLARYCAPPVS